MSQFPAQPVIPPRIGRELADGDELGFGDGAVAIAVMCGVFNVDRAQAAASLRRIATLDVTVACFGHGEPLTHDATAELRAPAQRLTADR